MIFGCLFSLFIESLLLNSFFPLTVVLIITEQQMCNLTKLQIMFLYFLRAIYLWKFQILKKILWQYYKIKTFFKSKPLFIFMEPNSTFLKQKIF